MKILIVEDDYLEEELLREVLRDRFRIKNEDISVILNEHEFVQEIGGILSSPSPPQLVIMDVMMRWANPAPEIPVPPDQVRTEGPTRAGLRCGEMLDFLNPTIPILFYTILERSDLDSDLFDRRPSGKTMIARRAGSVEYVRKDEGQDDLVDKLRSILSPHGQIE